MFGKSESGSRSSLAVFIERAANASGRTYDEIALAAGYSNDNIIHAFIADQAKVPLDRVPFFADALGCNAIELFELCLGRHFNEETFHRLRALFFRDTTENERAWLLAVKEASGERDPPLDEARAGRLKIMFE
jgi:hypothetical protein